MQTIRPFLWFDGKAEEAATFYVSVFGQDSSVGDVSRSDDGSARGVPFTLRGQEFLAFNGGPMFTFNPAVSFFVRCESQAEVDHFWGKLSEGGEKSRCGWLTDKYGLSWQVIPTALPEMLDDEDEEKSDRVMQAMLQMTKIDIAALKRAYDGA
jgi:predicted 3-demethylubiquinone-9 3-methyltransferase (glyoxalase superfamily)